MWLPVQLRGRAKAKSEGDGPAFESLKSRSGGMVSALILTISKDWTLASRAGSRASASAPGL